MVRVPLGRTTMAGFWRKALIAVLLCGCSGETQLGASHAALKYPRPPSIDRGNLPLAPKRLNAARAEYFGGPVISNPKLYVVWWGDPANIDPAITGAGGAVDFFTGVTNSNFLDWWNEYDTNILVQAGVAKGDAGTQQRIGRGNFVKAVALLSAPLGTVPDSTIQTTLNKAFADGTLPPPDGNTIYSISFPASVTITLDGSSSCSGFGGYHEAIIEPSGSNAYYLVLPDCGQGADAIVNSHELAEATTDPIPTPGSNPNYPQAWNDSMGNEIGDLCEAGGGSALIDLSTGQFDVQNIWNEREQNCVAFRSDLQDFNVFFPTNFGTVARGVSHSFTVQTSTVDGGAQSLTLTATAPAGVTATLASNVVTSGQSTSITVLASNPAVSNALQVVVRADGLNGGSKAVSHTASLLLDVSEPDGGTDAGGVQDAGSGGTDAGSPRDAGTTFDAGTTSDAGSGTPDAGAPPDAGSLTDAGSSADAGGTSDAGPGLDAGQTNDAGDQADAGPIPDAGSPVPDSGTTAPPDAGSQRPDAGSLGNGGGGGCGGCSSGPAGRGGFEWLAALAGLAFVRFRRREVLHGEIHRRRALGGA
jgi:MYXO-CTERM domain-containing protein